MDNRTIYASRGGKNFTGYSVANDAPIYSYNIKPNNINSWAIKDTGGQEWYLTDGGQWRNTATKALSKTMPSWAATANTAPAATAPTTPAPTAQNNVNPQATFKSIYEFLPKANENLFNMMPQKSVMDYIPKDWAGSPAYQNALSTGNKNLESTMAARGLLGSGAEIQAKNELSQNLLAQDTDRMMQAAQTDSQNNINETNNVRNLLSSMLNADFSAYNNQMQNASDREMQRDAQGVNVMSMILDYITKNNPMQYGFPATNTLMDNTLKIGSTLSSLAGSGGGGGGGGRGSAQMPTYAPPPRFQSSTNDLIGIGASVLPSLISAISKNY